MAMTYPLTIQRLISYFSKLPGIGKRTAERLAMAALSWNDSDLQGFSEVLSTLKQNIRPCACCGNLSEESLCPICQAPNRNQGLICVVEQPSQILVIENAGCYQGLYHVLGGKLAPLSGKGPETLRIKELKDRLAAGQVTELILATSPDVEGEATAHFLASECAGFGVTISRIASGVPVGADLNYADPATLSIAIHTRRTLE